MKILILGSQGFIGSNLVNYFIEKKYDVTGCDLIEFYTEEFAYHKVSILSSDFEDLFIKNIFDVCINASGSGNVGYSLKYPLNDFDANTITVAKVLDTIRKYQRNCKYLHISSAAVYGNPKYLPIDENHDLNPVSPYGFHKLMSEQVCKEYYQLFNIPIAIIRPFSVYGNGLKKQLFWDILQKIKTSTNNEIELWGTGKESRDFIHIKDLVELINIIIKQSPFTKNIYNAASGSETTIEDIVEIVKKIFKDIKIKFSGEVKIGDPINWVADIEKISNLSFSSKIKLETGINKYLNWFNEQYELRK